MNPISSDWPALRSIQCAYCVATIAATLPIASGCASAGSSNEQTQATQGAESTKEHGGFDIDCPSVVPANIAPPRGNKLKLALHVVKGTQDYACVNGAFALQNPEAILKNGRERDDALHFFGAPGSPVFVSDRDSSEVDLDKIAAAPAPAAGSVAWLLLKTVAVANAENGSPGLFSNITFVQRLNTHGGNPPAGACTVGRIVKIPYAADYFFYESGNGDSCK
jgi:hypothetical protein